MAPLVKAILGSIAFGIFWVLAVFPAVPFLPIGRTAGSLLGAVLMVVFRVITPDEAFAAVNLPILGLLFGTMVVGRYLEKADLFKYLGKLLCWKNRGGKDLLCRVCFVSAISSALFTNDTSCIVLTEFVIKIAQRNNLPPRIFLLALASSANIGSSATPIGNPQNLVIAVQGKISFGKFLIGILPSMIVGIVVNAVILLCYFWASRERVEDRDTEAAEEDEISENSEGEMSLSRKISVYLVTLGMLISLLAGLNMAWTAITAALVLAVLDFTDAGPCLEKVSFSLLVFFCGMFITVEGFNKTGIPSELWNLMEPYARIDRASGVVVLALAIMALSNLASNVPTVLLLGTRVAASAAAISAEEETQAWLILAWVSTVAGNLSLLGSAANLIVCEQARKSPSSSDLSFWAHLRFGLPSTLIVTAAGLLLLKYH